MENRQLLCDHCGEVLFGKVGTAYVSRNYVSVRGKLCYEKYNKDTGKYDFRYLLPNDTEEFMFCVRDIEKNGKIIGQDFSCMEAFFENRIASFNGNRQFDKVGEVAPAPEVAVPAKRPVGRPRKDSSLAPLVRPAYMPPFKLD